MENNRGQSSEKPKRKPSLKGNLAYQTIYQILSIIVPLVTTPYLSRALGPESLGEYSFTFAVASLFVMAGMLGMSIYGVREIASCGEDRISRSAMFWSIYTSQVIVGASSCIAYAAYVVFLVPEHLLQIAFIWSFLIISAPLDISWLFFGVEDFKTPTLRSAAVKLAALPIIFLFVSEPHDLWIYCAAIATSICAGQLVMWPFIKRYVDFVQPKWELVRMHFLPSIRLFLPILAMGLYMQVDKILLGNLASMRETGYFDYSERIIKIPMALITSMSVVMMPRMTAELSGGRRENAMSLLSNSMWAMMAMSFALAFGIAAIAPEVASVLLGKEFASCDIIITTIALIIPLCAMSNVTGSQYLIPTGRDKHYTTSLCIGAGVNVVANLALIPLFGAMGAAIATVATELAIMIIQVRFVFDELPFRDYARNALPYLVIGATMFVLVRITAAIFTTTLQGLPIAGLILEIAVGVLVFASLAITWCVATHDKHFTSLVTPNL